MRESFRGPLAARACALVALAATVLPAAALADSWTMVTDMPMPRSYVGGTAPYGSTVFVMGGSVWGSSGYLSSLKSYDVNSGGNSWISHPGMRYPRKWASVESINSKIYVVGGWDGKALNVLEEYDPATKKWTNLPPMPTARYGAGIVSWTGRLIVFGGHDGTNPLNTVEMYESSLKVWYTMAPMPTARWALGAALAQDDTAVQKAYVMGGSDGTKTLSTVEVYDPNVDVWWTCTCVGIPVARMALSLAVTNNISTGDKIFAVGGYLSATLGILSGTVGEFDPQTIGPFQVDPNPSDGVDQGNWVTLEPRDPIQGVAWASLGTDADQTLYLVGGIDSSGMRATMQRFERQWISPPYTGRWVNWPSLPMKRAYHGGVTTGTGVNARVWVAAGAGPFLDANQAYDGVQDVWSPASAMITERAGLAVSNPIAGTVYVIGGTNGADLAVNEGYCLERDDWVSLKPLTWARKYAAAAAAAGRVYVFGGLMATSVAGESGTVMNSTDRYDPPTDTWLPMAPMPTRRYLHAAITLGGSIYVFGGATALQNGAQVAVIYLATAEVYDPNTNSWTALPSMLTPRASPSVAVSPGGMIYVAGGINSGGSTAVVERYNPVTRTWDARTRMGNNWNGGDYPRHGMVLGGPPGTRRMWAIGGEYSGVQGTFDVMGNWATSGTRYSTTERYDRDPGFLVSSLEITPNPIRVGREVTFLFTVTNTGDAPVDGITATLAPPPGTCPLELSNPPFVGPTDLSPGEATVFVWTVTICGGAQYDFQADAKGTDGETALPVVTTAWNDVSVTAAYRISFDLQMDMWPMPLAAGSVLTVTMTVSNVGGGTAYATSGLLTWNDFGGGLFSMVTAPSSTVMLGPGTELAPTATTFYWTLSVSGAGYALFRGRARAVDEIFGTVTTYVYRSTLPSSPSGLKVAQGDSSLSVTWAVNPSYEAVSAYEVFRATYPEISGAPSELVAVVTVPRFDDTGLANAVRYYYRVTAINGYGTSPPCAPVSAMPLTLPGKVGDVWISSNGPRPLCANPLRGEMVQVLANVPAGAGTLRVTIYNLAGEKVRLLFHEGVPPGPRIIEWDGRNDRGHVVASAGYLVVVEFPDGKRVIRKAAILK